MKRVIVTMSWILVMLTAVIASERTASAASPSGIEGRVVIEDYMPQGCSKVPCGPYPRVYPAGDIEVVAKTRSGRIVARARSTPNGNFFLRLSQGRFVLSAPALGISQSVRVNRGILRGVKLAQDVY